MLLVETLCMLIRIYYFKNKSWFNAGAYCKSVILKSLPPVLTSSMACLTINILVESDFRPLYTYVSAIPIFWMTSLNQSEKTAIYKFFKRVSL